MGFFRTLLMCLLVLAVPAQGSAAVTMAFCGPNHHGTGQAPDAEHHASAANASQGSEHAAAGTPDEHDDDHHPKAGAGADSGVSDPGAPHVKFVHADKHKCSACASCCSAAAILGTMPVVAVASAAPTVFDSVVPTVSAFAADGPDRPPRPVLA